MEAISGSDVVLSVFRVGCGGVGLWLITDDGRPDRFWFADDRHVFLVPV